MTPAAARPEDRSRPISRSVAAAAVAGGVLLVLPLIGLAAEISPSAVRAVSRSDEVAAALRLSLITSSVAAAVATVIGVPLAWVLAHARGWSVRVLRTLVLIPMVLPPVVIGVALLATFGRNGLVGSTLDAVGVRLPFSSAGVVVAQAVVAAPFVVVAAEGGFRASDHGLLEAARVSGAGPLRAMVTVGLPLARSSLLAGVALAWARALGEFGATVTFAGNLAGRTRTLPLEVVTALEVDRDLALGISGVQMTVAALVLLMLRGRWWPR